MGNRLGYAQSDVSGEGKEGEAVGVGDGVPSPLIEDIPDVDEETPEQTLDDIISMIVSKYETVISSGALVDGNLATIPELRRRNQQLQGTLAKIIQILKEKQNASRNLGKHNEALQHQVDSLKDVIAITRDLLNIRNTEVEHLHEDLQNLQDKITLERKRQVEVTEKMDSASKLNDSLKAEYQKQIDLFSKLRVKYEERQEALARENALLQKQLDIAKNIVNSQHSSTDTPSGAPTVSPLIIPTSVTPITSPSLNEDEDEPLISSPRLNADETGGPSPSLNEDEDGTAVSVVLKSVDNVLRLETSTDVDSTGQDEVNIVDSD